MLASKLIALSAAIALAMGSGHLLLTFVGEKLKPRDPTLRARMTEVPMGISRNTTMWKAWIGFNASHSLGVMLFGLIYGYLALAQPALLFSSPFLLVVGFAMLASLVWLARVYWFVGPFTGVSIALACYVLGLVVSLA